MRAIIAGAASGSSAVLPAKLWPLVTVSRFLPSLSISSSSPAWLEADRPSTATIAATPIAIPSAGSAARARRVRRPTLATRARSDARSRRGASCAAAAGSRARSARTLTARSRRFVDERERRRPGGRGAGHDDVAAGPAVGGEGRRERDPAGVRVDLDRACIGDALAAAVAAAGWGADGEEPAGAGGGGGEGDARAGHGVVGGVGDGDGEADRERAARGGGLAGAGAGGDLGGRAGAVDEREADRREAGVAGFAGGFAGAAARERGGGGERAGCGVGGEGGGGGEAAGVGGGARLGAAAGEARAGGGARAARAGGGGAERERDGRAGDGVAAGVEHPHLQRPRVAALDARRHAPRRDSDELRGDAGGGVRERERHGAVLRAGGHGVAAG